MYVADALSIEVMNALMLEFDFIDSDIAEAWRCCTISNRKFVHALVEKQIITNRSVAKLVHSLQSNNSEELASEVEKEFAESFHKQNGWYIVILEKSLFSF